MTSPLSRGFYCPLLFAVVFLAIESLLVAGPTAPAKKPPRCSSGALVTSLDLKVAPPAGGEQRPLRETNAIPAGYRIIYTPGHFPSGKPKDSRVSLMLSPVDPNGKVEVTDPVRGDQAVEWKAPFRVGVAGLVFGPEGLNKKKVRSMVTADSDLITQLAEYAEKSTQAENLAQALAEYDQQANSRQNLEAALTGFSGAFNLSVSKLDSGSSVDERAAIALRAVNPTMSTYDPLSSQGAAKYQQTATLAASVAGLFWGPSVTAAAGGTALFMNLRGMMFPSTDLRSTFAQPASGTMALCAARETQKARTRLAYLWAAKLPDLDPPKLVLARPAHVAAGLRAEVPLKPAELEARFLLRARDWRLIPTGSGKAVPVRVLPATASGKLGAIQLDLTAAEVPAGQYVLAARWDWTEIKVDGDVHVHKVMPLAGAKITPESGDRLITGAGPVAVELTGADFQFVNKVSLKKNGDPVAKAMPIETIRQDGAAPGPKSTLQVAVDTRTLIPGSYTLLIEQEKSPVTEIPLRILPRHPGLDGLPLRVNLGEKQPQTVTLRGEGLDRIEGVSAEGAEVELLPGRAVERPMTVRLLDSAQKGDRIALRLGVEGVHADVVAQGALLVAAPRPRVSSVTLSAPPEAPVEVREKELVAGIPRTFSIRASGLDNTTRVRVECDDPARTLAPISVRSGQSSQGAEMQQTGPETLFLSLEPGKVGPPGCGISLVVETDGEGPSDAVQLGKVVRLPRIETFEFTEQKTGDGLYGATIEGYDLDTIAKTGWNSQEGHAVLALPSPVPGQIQKQSLRIALPWPPPSPRAPIYVFLHGEATGRLTKARL